MELLEIYNDDCFNVFPKIKDKSIDLFILDLPYGQTACAWDTPIDLERMWVEIKRMMKPSAVICFFCTTKFGYSLIKSNEKWFKYDLIWKKSRKVGFLSANKRQLRNHENIYVFKEEQGVYNPQKTEGKPYKAFETKNNKKIGEVYGGKSLHNENKGDRHPTSIIEHENVYVFKKEQGTYNPQKTEGKPYNKIMTGNNNEQKIIYGECLNGKVHQKGNRVINKGDRHPTSIIEHENVYVFKNEQGTYNPQKTPREKDYKHSGQRSSNTLYNGDVIDYNTLFKKEDGLHPTSIMDYGQHTKPENTILEYKSVKKTLHRTEKPVGLLEYLIKTYSNEREIVMDFTMGSASTGEACFNTKRKFIGVEMDDDIFVLAQERLANLDEN